MKKPIAKLSLAAVLALLLAVCLLATAGPALAGTPTCAPSFTFSGGWAGDLDPGTPYFDTPALGNLTALHWRFYTLMQVRFPGAIEEQSWSMLYDWSLVLLDKPGQNYPEDLNDLIPGWHYHWATGVVSTTLDPSGKWPSMPPKETWLWTTKATGFTTPAGVHYITEYWTGCNQYKGLKAFVTWTMKQSDFQDQTGKVWILH